jgi:Lar family restriction alleviation protein
MPNKRLLPCPFCGCKDIKTEDTLTGWEVLCSGCLIAIGSFANKATAIIRWNTRAGIPKLDFPDVAKHTRKLLDKRGKE